VPIVLKSRTLNLLEPFGSVQACNGTALPLRKGRRPWSFVNQRFRHTIRLGKRMSTSELVSNKERLYVVIICEAFCFVFSPSIKFHFYGTGIIFLAKTNFFPTHNSRTTICVLFFLKHLYCNITLRILTCCNQQEVNIEVTTFCILLVESCEMVTEFARNEKIYNISSEFISLWKRLKRHH